MEKAIFWCDSKQNSSDSLLHLPVEYIIHNISYIRDKVTYFTRIFVWFCDQFSFSSSLFLILHVSVLITY